MLTNDIVSFEQLGPDVLWRQIKQIHKSEMTENYRQITATKTSLPKTETMDSTTRGCIED